MALKRFRENLFCRTNAWIRYNKTQNPIKHHLLLFIFSQPYILMAAVFNDSIKIYEASSYFIKNTFYVLVIPELLSQECHYLGYFNKKNEDKAEWKRYIMNFVVWETFFMLWINDIILQLLCHILSNLCAPQWLEKTYCAINESEI